jgi:hypothetical protein
VTEQRGTHVLVLLIALLGLAVLLARGPLLMNDFVEYWAAARLVLSGGNPYDPAQMLAVERSVGFAGAHPLLMLNPPPVLTLVLPFGAMPYRQAALFWLVVNTVALLWSVYLLWDLAGGSIRSSWIAFFSGLLFVPSLFALLMGQISIFILLGLVLFLRFVNRDRMIAAGAASTLLLIKPHVVFLVGAAIVAWWIRVRDRDFLRGAAIAALLCLTPLVLDPAIYTRYLEMGRVEPMWHFSTSTLGTMLRIATGDPSRFGFQFLPMFLGFAYLATRLRRYRGSQWNWEREMPALVTVSVATAAYGWVFDQVVLLVAATPMLAIALRSGVSARVVTLIFWLLITVVSFEQAIRSVNSFWYFWMPHAFLIALLLFGMSFRHHRRRHVE